MGRNFSISTLSCLPTLPASFLGPWGRRVSHARSLASLVPCPEPRRQVRYIWGDTASRKTIPGVSRHVHSLHTVGSVPRDDSRAKGSLRTSIITSWPTCLLEARLKPPLHTSPCCRSAICHCHCHCHCHPISLVSSHRALGTEHTGALGTGRAGQGVCCVVNVSPPLFQFTHPLYPPSVSPRPPDAANTGSAQFSPQRSFRSPRTRDSPARLHHENLAGLFPSHPRLSCDRSRGWSPHTLTVLSKPSSVPLRRAPPGHQRTPELDASSSVWNRPSKYLHASFVISGAAWPSGRQRSRSS